jgi:leader peptidase (prepilin peptidase) / N-methyltransferase
MNLAWAAAGAVLGAPPGAVMRGPVFALSVAGGAADGRACPRCGADVSPRPAVRCAQCGGLFGPPAVFELATAGVLALLFARFGGSAAVAAFAFLGVLGVALSAIDIAVQRLPNRLTLPAYPVMVALLGVAAVFGHSGGSLVRALLGGVALAAVYLFLAVVRPGQLGAGDVKLAGLTGLALGWVGWPVVVFGAALGFVLSALVSVALLATCRLTMRSSISFGPFMLGGALLAIVLSGL